jgi:hypothetical protein
VFLDQRQQVALRVVSNPLDVLPHLLHGFGGIAVLFAQALGDFALWRAF